MSSSIPPAIEVVDVTKHYDARAMKLTSAIEFRNFIKVFTGKKDKTIKALDGVSFSVSPGEVFGLLGPNGAGKTTLIKILSTLIIPDSGRVLVQGIDVVRNPREVLKVLQTVLAESFGFERRLSGRQNLEFYATLYGIKKDVAARRIDELLNFSHLSEFGDEMFQKYSTGMAKRLLICRALLLDAGVLILDEPTAGLDPISSAEFRRFLKEVVSKEGGKTVMIATHNLWEAEQICDRIALLKKGKITAIGKPSEIRYRTVDKVGISLVLQLEQMSDPDILQYVKQVDGVLSAAITERIGEKALSMSLDIEKSVNYNELFEVFTRRHYRISSIETSQPTLEDAFLKLTTGAAE